VRAKLALLGVALAALPVLAWLEHAGRFAELRASLQEQSVPVSLLESGRLGQKLRDEKLVRLAPGEAPDAASLEAAPDTPPTPFAAKRGATRDRFAANPVGAAVLSSTSIVSASDFVAPWPLISVVTDPANLDDPETGIFTHILEKGRKWERSAFVSYFEDGQLVFESGVGLRLHGGSTLYRRFEKRVRLHFRPEYGAEAFPPGILFGPETEPLRALIVRTDDNQFATPLAFDISRRVGAKAPETQPVLFYLNGELRGRYYLVEHPSREQWANHIGHDDFAYYRYKSEDPEPPEHVALRSWARGLSNEVSVETAVERIDLDNFSRHVFSIVFCGTNDWTQGAAVRDRRDPDGRWFFVNWDMDAAFVDYGAAWKQGQRPEWAQEAFELLLSDHDFRDRENPARPINRGDVRQVIFTRLLRDSPAFRESFVRLATDLMNHRIDPAWLLGRVRYYRDVLGVPIPAEREDFARHRADFVRADLQRHFGAGALHTVRVEAPEGWRLEIDGYPEGAAYTCHYFEGQEVHVAAASDSPGAIAGFDVDGVPQSGAELRLAVRGDHRIEAVTR